MSAAHDLSRAAWHDARRLGIGASEVAACFGRHPYISEWDLWRAKTDPKPPEPETADQRRGNLWEGPVVAAYALDRGVYVRRNTDVVVGPEDWIRATPDGQVFPDRFHAQARHRLGLCEIKTARRRDGWADESTGSLDDVPWHYACQALWQLAAVPGAPWVDLVVLLPYYETRVYRIERDEGVIAGLVSVARAWWTRHVLAGEPPGVDGSDACVDYLLRQPRAGERAATDEEATWARERVGVQAQIRALETQKAEIDGRLLASMAGSERLTLSGGRVSIVERAGSVKWKSVAEAMHAPAEIVAQHTGAPSRYLDVRLKESR